MMTSLFFLLLILLVWCILYHGPVQFYVLST